jgi:hypothetical protein
MKKLISLKNPFYNTYIIEKKLLEPVLDVFLANKCRNNLLDSLVRDLFISLGVIGAVCFQRGWQYLCRTGEKR